MEEDVKALHKTRASKRKYHFIYKTTCLVTGRWYIGMHSTDVVEDGYLGSGKRLWYSINKHGAENHVREVLEYCEDRKSLATREKEIVNAEMLKEERCMNLKVGGEGGWEIYNSNSDLQRDKGQRGNDKMRWLRCNNLAWTLRYAKRLSEGQEKSYNNGRKIAGCFSDEIRREMVLRAASLKAKAKRKATNNQRKFQQGENNSNYGLRFTGIHKDGCIKKVKHNEVENYLADGWVLGFKDKVSPTLTKKQKTINAILASDVDVTQEKWAIKLAEEVGMTRNGVKKFIKKYIPDIWNNCFIEVNKIRVAKTMVGIA